MSPRKRKLIGRLLIVVGFVLAGFFSTYGFLPRPEGTWKRYPLTAIQKRLTPRHGHVERVFRLVIDNEPFLIEVEAETAGAFNAALLQAQQRPTEIEVLSDHEARDGIVRADGIRLVDGRNILDPDIVHKARRPYEIFGVIVCSMLVIMGVALQAGFSFVTKIIRKFGHSSHRA